MLSFVCTSENDEITSEINKFLYLKNMNFCIESFNIEIDNPSPIWNDGFLIQLKIEKLRKIVNFRQYDIICVFVNNKAYWYLNKTNLGYLTEFNKDQSPNYREFIKESLNMLFNVFEKEIAYIYEMNIKYPHMY